MKRIYLIIILLVLFSFSSCKKFLDINHDPDAIENVPIKMILPSALSSPMYILGGDGQIIGAYWAQQWTQSTNSPQYQGFDSWQITNSTFDGRGYGALYYYSLTDLKRIKNEARKTENWSYYLMATVIESYVYQTLVDLYDNVPYTDAIQGEEGNITPEFDMGEDIYTNIVDSLKYALNLDVTTITSEDPEESDIIFNGDMNKWKEFANTLLLKIYLRESFKKDMSSEITSLNGSFLSEDADFNIFVNQSDKRNPIYATAEIEQKGNISMSRTLIGYLIDDMYGSPNIRDSRVDYLAYRPNKVPEAHRALLQGDFYANSNVYYLGGSSTVNYWGAENIEYLSRPLILYDTPLYYMTLAESYFLQAEADIRYKGGAEAQDLYENGVKAAFRRLGLTDTDAQVILDDVNYAAWSSATTDDERLNLIWMQKWVSMTNIQGIEAFIEHNRTDTPKEFNVNPNSDPINWDDDYERGWFTVSVNNVTNGRFPRRLLVPQSEIDGNPNVPDEMRNKKIYDPVWWDVN